MPKRGGKGKRKSKGGGDMAAMAYKGEHQSKAIVTPMEVEEGWTRVMSKKAKRRAKRGAQRKGNFGPQMRNSDRGSVCSNVTNVEEVHLDVKVPIAEAKRFKERFLARDRNSATNNATDAREDRDGATKSPLLLHTEGGLLRVWTGPSGKPILETDSLVGKKNSTDEHFLLPPPALPLTQTASEAPTDGQADNSGQRRTRRFCCLM